MKERSLNIKQKKTVIIIHDFMILFFFNTKIISGVLNFPDSHPIQLSHPLPTLINTGILLEKKDKYMHSLMYLMNKIEVLAFL